MERKSDLVRELRSCAEYLIWSNEVTPKIKHRILGVVDRGKYYADNPPHIQNNIERLDEALRRDCQYLAVNALADITLEIESGRRRKLTMGEYEAAVLSGRGWEFYNTRLVRGYMSAGYVQAKTRRDGIEERIVYTSETRGRWYQIVRVYRRRNNESTKNQG